MKFKLLAGLISGVIIIFLLKLFLPDEPARVRRDIYRLKKAVEKEDITEVLKYVDDDYNDRYGNNYEKLVQNIGRFFNQADSIKVMFSGLRVTIDSINKENFVFASCSLGLRVLASYQGNRTLIFGGVIKPGPVKAFFKKTGDRYQLYGAVY